MSVRPPTKLEYRWVNWTIFGMPRGTHPMRQRMDRDYEPVELWVYATDAPGTNMRLDVQDDGASIFTVPFYMQSGVNEGRREVFGSSPTTLPIEKDSTLTLEITELGGADRVTVALKLLAREE